MYQSTSPSFRGACRAILTAGPLFVALTMAAMLYMQLPKAIIVDPAALVATCLLLLFALIFGPLVACVPIVIGTVAMRGLSRSVALLSSRPAWTAIGLIIGIGVSYFAGLLRISGEVAFALTITCGVSAWLSHNPEGE